MTIKKCIFPLEGHTDYVTNSVEISEKEEFVKLGVGDNFSCSYEIAFGK